MLGDPNLNLVPFMLTVLSGTMSSAFVLFMMSSRRHRVAGHTAGNEGRSSRPGLGGRVVSRGTPAFPTGVTWVPWLRWAALTNVNVREDILLVGVSLFDETYRRNHGKHRGRPAGRKEYEHLMLAMKGESNICACGNECVTGTIGAQGYSGNRGSVCKDPEHKTQLCV